MYKTAVKILQATVGIQSNLAALLPHLTLETKIESLLTDFKMIEEIPFTPDLDGYISIEETEAPPTYEIQDDRILFKGPFLKLNKEASDPRYMFWGNQGFLYRYTLYLLEKKHRIYNFHACALYDENENNLYVIIGGAGSGKTVFLLRGLEKGLKLFSTETVHFHIEQGKVTWHMGSLVDNVRFGTLLYDFPRLLPDRKKPNPQESWQKKIAIDLSEYKTNREIIENPSAVHILFPRIERGFEKTTLNPIKNKRKAAKGLFENISQKLTETIILYDTIVVLGLDETELARNRLKAVDELVNHNSVSQITSILSNPRDCWDHILK
jgi:hypothetical protein